MKDNIIRRFAAFVIAALAPLAMLYAGEMNRVVIDAKGTGAEISPLLFGHNPEITRRGVWRGLGALLGRSSRLPQERRLAVQAGYCYPMNRPRRIEK